MTETLFGYVAVYGLPAVALSAFLSCLALPIPTFAVMLAAGAFAAAGDLVLWQVLAAAFAGAVAGDQTGYQIGRWGGPTLTGALSRSARTEPLVTRAAEVIRTRGGPGVFFSTWLFAPLGPWVNLAAGLAGMGRLRFTVWDAAGEAIWVGVYVGLGWAFGSRLPELVELVGDGAGLVTSAGLVLVFGGLLLRRALRRRG